jgi:hypothetical protein
VGKVVLSWVAVIAITTFAAGAGRTAAANVPSATPRVAVATAAPRQFADEITRRLRRMGINVIKTRLDNPYDSAGELC